MRIIGLEFRRVLFLSIDARVSRIAMSRPASPRRSQRATNSPKSGWRNVTEGTCTAAESPKAHFSKDESAPHASLVIALGHEAVMRTMGPYAVCSRLLGPNH